MRRRCTTKSMARGACPSGSGVPASYQPLAVSGGGTWSSVTNHYYYQ